MKIRILVSMLICLPSLFMLALCSQDSDAQSLMEEESLLDEALAEKTKPLTKPLQTIPSQTIKAAPARRLRRSSHTKQEKLEQDILDAIVELTPIAQGLSGFVASPEAKKALDEKTKEYEAKVKEAEQRRKTQLGSKGGTWRPSSGSGGYGPSYGSGRSGTSGGWGGSDYGYGSGTGGWGGTGSGGTGWSPSGTTESSLPKAEEKTEGLGAGKETETAKDKMPKGLIDPKALKKEEEKRKSNNAAYDKATETFETASKKIEAALSTIEGKNKDDAARTLLRSSRFSSITPLLDGASKAEPELSKEEITKIDPEKKKLFDAAQGRYNGLLSQLFPHALQAATFDNPSNFKNDEQKAALHMLNNQMGDLCEQNKEKINKRADEILSKWNASHSGQEYSKAVADLQPALIATRAGGASVVGGHKDKAACLAVFQAAKTELEVFVNKFPQTPQSIETKLTEIDKKIQDTEKP